MGMTTTTRPAPWKFSEDAMKCAVCDVDCVGLDGRERVILGDAPLLLILFEADVAQRALEHGGGRFDCDQPLFGFDLSFGSADDANHLVDIRVGQ